MLLTLTTHSCISIDIPSLGIFTVNILKAHRSMECSSSHYEAHVTPILPLGQSSQYSSNRGLTCPHERSESIEEHINL